MSDLISRSALIAYMCGHCGASCNLEDECCANVDAVENAQAVDAVEVVHGKWNRIPRGNYECSRCGCSPYYAESIYTLHYCPNCGAKMHGGEDND